MTEQHEIYQITGSDLQALTQGINQIFARLADRLDRLEGHRGRPKFWDSTFDFSDVISGVFKAASTGDSATFSNLVVSDIPSHGVTHIDGTDDIPFDIAETLPVSDWLMNVLLERIIVTLKKIEYHLFLGDDTELKDEDV